MGRLGKLMRMLLHYPLRLFNKTSFRATVIDSRIHRSAAVEHHANVRYSTVGRYTYVSARSALIHAEVGAFCSIAAGVSVGGGAHKLDSVSTSPAFFAGKNVLGVNLGNERFAPYKSTVIGNDVWIGNRAMILQGVHIGDGAVIGAGAVVTKDVAPYTIVAGNPAREIRKRFDEDTVERLVRSRWWDMDVKKLTQLGAEFSSPSSFLDAVEGEKKVK